MLQFLFEVQLIPFELLVMINLCIFPLWEGGNLLNEYGTDSPA